jgi:CheY-like chemotaxis protein
MEQHMDVIERLVMVVDDDESVRDAFYLALVDEPYRVVVCSSGDEAIEAAKGGRPDLVFLDLKMPGKDGVETMRGLFAVDPTMRVYVVTAFAEEFMDRLRDARNSGLTFQIVSKPINDEQIRLIAAATLG